MNVTLRIEEIRKRRRKLVKKYGKKIFRRIDQYFGEQSLIPNDQILDSKLFPWTADLEAGWKDMQVELLELLRHRDELPRFQDISPDQYRISPDDKWKTFVFYGFGFRSDHNSGICPKTAAVLDRIPRIENAFFSILAPGKHVPAHKGVSKALVRCHLGLIVPTDAERCTMDVGGVTCQWQEGRAFVFDDTYPHSVRNDTQQQRAVLLLDVPRPMTLRGRAVRNVVFWLFKKTGFVREAFQNELQWEERFRNARLAA